MKKPINPCDQHCPYRSCTCHTTCREYEIYEIENRKWSKWVSQQKFVDKEFRESGNLRRISR